MKENCMMLRLWGRKEEERAGLCKITLRKSQGLTAYIPVSLVLKVSLV